MKGDYTRFTHDKKDNYNRVQKQQGRVSLDSDWNEHMDIITHHKRTRTIDIIGSRGAPIHANGFQIYHNPYDSGNDDWLISTGRIYVDGILCECHPTDQVPIKKVPNIDAVQISTLEGESIDPTLEGPVINKLKVNGVELGINDLILIFAKNNQYGIIAQIQSISEESQGQKYNLNLIGNMENINEQTPLFLRLLKTCSLIPSRDQNIWNLVYLDVWERHITHIEDPDIREKALGGPDTDTRMETITQVKNLPVTDGIHCLKAMDRLNEEFPPSGGLLRFKVRKGEEHEEPCEVSEEGGYRGLENHLYRVEIHKGGELNTATFKWSRDNGSIVFGIAEFAPDGDTNKIRLKHLGRDQNLTLHDGDWVEISDNISELDGIPGTMARIDGPINEADRIVKLNKSISGYNKDEHAKMRLWNQNTEEITVPPGEIELELGLYVEFKGGNFKTGDYWVFPARKAKPSAENDVPAGDDPSAEDIEYEPPRGIKHHYCPLAIVKFQNDEWSVEDCRPIFYPLTGMTSLYFVGGDGQESMPGEPLEQPLRVKVANGGIPIEGAKVRFCALDGGTVVEKKEDFGSNGACDEVDIETIADGTASCRWKLENNHDIPSQRVVATLLNAYDEPIRDEYGNLEHVIHFNANLSIASQVFYDSGACPKLAGQETVQDAIDTLCKITNKCCVTVGDGTKTHGQFETIDAALNYLYTQEKEGELCLLPGHYEANVTIDGKRSIKIRGCGTHTIVTPEDPSKPIFTVQDSQNIVLEHMSLATIGVAVHLEGSYDINNNCSLREVAIRQNNILALGNAIFVKDGEGIRIHDNHIRMMDQDGGGTAIYIKAEDSVIKRNDIGITYLLPPPDLGGDAATLWPFNGYGRGSTFGRDEGYTSGSPRDAAFEEGSRPGEWKVYTGGDGEFPRVEITNGRYTWIPGADVTATPSFKALGGIQIAGGSERIWVTGNKINGGSGNGITLGSSLDLTALRNIISTEDWSSDLEDIFAFIYNVTIDNNEISNMGLSGIGIPYVPPSSLSFLDTSSTTREDSSEMNRLGVLKIILLQFGNSVIIDLDINRNQIINCMQNPFDEDMKVHAQLRGFGGIALGTCGGLSICKNHVEKNGRNHLDPVCGIHLVNANPVEIEQNLISNNGPMGGNTNGEITPGIRGGIVMTSSNVLPVLGSDQTSTFSKLWGKEQIRAGDTVRIQDNVVHQIVGKALDVVGMAPISISNNQFNSLLSYDPVFFELGLDDPVIVRGALYDFSGFDGLTEVQGDIQVTIGDVSKKITFPSKIDTIEDLIDTLERGIHKASRSRTYTGTRIVKIDNNLLFLPGNKEDSITFAQIAGGPALDDLGLVSPSTVKGVECDLSRFRGSTNETARFKIAIGTEEWREVEISGRTADRDVIEALKAGIRTADSSDTFTKAEVVRIDDRLLIFPGIVDDDIIFGRSGDLVGTVQILGLRTIPSRDQEAQDSDSSENIPSGEADLEEMIKDGRFYDLANRLFSPNTISFVNNRTLTGPANESRYSQRIFSGDDICFMHNISENFYNGPLTNTHLMGWTIRAKGNRFKEMFNQEASNKKSLYTMGYLMNNTSNNQGNHLICAYNMYPDIWPVIKTPNQIIDQREECHELKVEEEGEEEEESDTETGGEKLYWDHLRDDVSLALSLSIYARDYTVSMEAMEEVKDTWDWLQKIQQKALRG